MGLFTLRKRTSFPIGLAALSVTFALSLGACSSSQTEGESEDVSLEEATDEMAQTDPAPAEGAELVPDAAASADPNLDDVAALDAMDGPPITDTPTQAPEAMPPEETVAGLDSSAPAPIADTPAYEPPPAMTEPVAQSGSGQYEDYSVQGGDTLMKIAFETYGDVYQWKKIYEDNRDRIQDPNRIPSGTVLKLEKASSPVAIDRSGDRFQIRPGDTLGKISSEIYGTPRKWRKIYERNKTLIRDPNRIFAGFYVYYTVTPEERQEAERLRQEREAPAPTPDPLANAAPPAPAPAAEPARAPASAAPVQETPPAQTAPAAQPASP